MRHYSADSREAVARIVALAMMADGAIDRSETESMKYHQIAASLGLDDILIDRVMHEFCEDLFSFAALTPTGQHQLDPATIDGLLADIGDPTLQAKLFSAILNIVNAEGQLLCGEVMLVERVLKAWPLVSGARPSVGNGLQRAPSFTKQTTGFA